MLTGKEQLNGLDPDFGAKFQGTVRILAEQAQRKEWSTSRGRGDRTLFNNLQTVSKQGVSNRYEEGIYALVVGTLQPPLDDPKYQNFDKNVKNEIVSTLMGCCLYAGSIASGFDQSNEQHTTFVLDQLKSDKNLKIVIGNLNKELAKDSPSIDAISKIKSSSIYLVQNKASEQTKQISNTISIRVEMEQPYNKVEGQAKGLNRFQFEAAKTEGIEPGVIARKKRDAEPKPGSKKYEHRWMVKKQSTRENVADVMGAEMARFFISDNAPKDRLISSNTQDSSKSFIASRFIENFQTLQSIYPEIDARAPGGKVKMYEKAYKEIPGMYDVAAVNILMGNYDFHLENIGVVTKDKSRPDVREAATIDFGKALNFQLVPSDLAFIISDKMKADDKPQVGQPLKPGDLMRALHGDPYEFSSPIFLNEHFAKALNHISDEVEKNPRHFESIVRKTAEKIKSQMTESQMQGIFQQVSPQANYANFADEMVKAAKQRVVDMKEFALDINVQVALKNNDHEKLNTLLTDNPQLLEKPIKWLAEANDPQIPKASTITEYAKATGRSAAVMDIIVEHSQQEKKAPVVSDVAAPRKNSLSEKPVLGSHTAKLHEQQMKGKQAGIEVR